MSSNSIDTIVEEPEELSNSEPIFAPPNNNNGNTDDFGEIFASCIDSVTNVDSSILVNDTMSEGNVQVPPEEAEPIKDPPSGPQGRPEGIPVTTSKHDFGVDRQQAANTVAKKAPKYITEDASKDSKDQCEVCKFVSTVGPEVFNNHAQEPWPKDVKLFQPYEVEQILLPDNANCLAVQTFLKMCNLEYMVEARANAEAMSPTGKVPFIKCGAFIVAELEGIVQFVGSKGISLTQELSSENKSDMRAYMTLVNNVLGNAELFICWCDMETYSDVTKPRYGSIHPWPLNHIQAWSKRSEEIKRLKVLSWYNKTIEEVYNDVETCCQALTDRLDGNEYFFGSKPTELEALIFGHLYTILTTPLPNAILANTVKNFPELINLITRIEKQYFQRETQH